MKLQVMQVYILELPTVTRLGSVNPNLYSTPSGSPVKGASDPGQAKKVIIGLKAKGIKLETVRRHPSG